jgi:hypothetical protein
VRGCSEIGAFAKSCKVASAGPWAERLVLWGRGGGSREISVFTNSFKLASDEETGTGTLTRSIICAAISFSESELMVCLDIASVELSYAKVG